MSATGSKLNGRYQRLQDFRRRHASAEIAVFFAAGFLFDILTLSRIDDLATLVQQGLYLVLLGTLMIMDERYRAGLAAPPRWLAKAWRFSEDAIHFLFGSLLSSFVIFYLKSSSGFSSLLFMSILGALLVANELPRVRERGPVVRFALLSLCVTSYGAVLLPVVLGFIRKWMFVTAAVLACAAIGWCVRALSRWTGDAPSVHRRVAGPALGMQAILVVAYFAGAIPPVPLSVQFIGIYHEVVPPGAQAATEGGDPPAGRTYELRHQRPWWKVWHHGDQDFAARPGDIVHCFARVFAPSGFRDAIYVRWRWQGPEGGWMDQGRAQLGIIGGRGDGFRTFATKKNYQPGRWRVEIETDDGRDIGIIHFDLVNDLSSGERSFFVDRL
ncbi:MAG: DUF2914 domain-containing protein [Candidatus Polarisedimenticolia bacterium]